MANEKNINSRIQQKHDIEANWLKAENFVPKAGEIIVYDTDENHNYSRFKIGDGVNNVNLLSFTSAINIQDGDGINSIAQINAVAAGENSAAFGVNQSEKIADDYNLALSITKGYNNTEWYNTDGTGSGATEDIVPIEPLTEPEYYKDGTTEITSVHDITFTTTGAHGVNAYSEGNNTLALGNYTHTEGYKTYAAASGSHAEGFMNVVFGVDSHSEGARNISVGQASHTEGMRNTALGKGSHIEGFKNQTGRKSTWSHIEGEGNLIKGMASHGEGAGNIIYDDIEVIETVNEDGSITTTEKNNIAYSHVEGYSNKVDASKAHAEGEFNIVRGASAHAEGKNTQANAKQSHTEGIGTIANGNFVHVQGQYNIPAPMSYADIVGNGKSDTERSNAYTLKWTGDAHYAGDVYANSEWEVDSNGKLIATGNKLATETEVTNSLQALAAETETAINTAINNLNIENGSGTRSIQQENATASNQDTAAFNDSTASGKYATSFGLGTTAATQGTTASGYYTHAQGSNYQSVRGRANLITSGKNNQPISAGLFADIVGGGSSSDSGATRANIYTLDWSGNAHFAGDVYAGATWAENSAGKNIVATTNAKKKLATEEYVDNKFNGGGSVDIISEEYILSLFA